MAPHETLVDVFYGGSLYLCHVVSYHWTCFAMTPVHECFAMNLFQDCLPALPHHRAFLATWFILYRENVLDGTESAFRGVLFRENVLTCTECVCPVLILLLDPCYVFH